MVHIARSRSGRFYSTRIYPRTEFPPHRHIFEGGRREFSSPLDFSHQTTPPRSTHGPYQTNDCAFRGAESGILRDNGQILPFAADVGHPGRFLTRYVRVFVTAACFPSNHSTVSRLWTVPNECTDISGGWKQHLARYWANTAFCVRWRISARFWTKKWRFLAPPREITFVTYIKFHLRT